jgi:hypothetical protein
MTVFITGLFWVLTHRIGDATTDRILFASGAALVTGGLVLRLARYWASTTAVDPVRTRISDCLLGLGLGVATAAPVLMALTGLACLARWSNTAGSSGVVPVERPSWVYDSLYLVGAVVTMVVIQALKGLVPLQ